MNYAGACSDVHARRSGDAENARHENAEKKMQFSVVLSAERTSHSC